MFWQNDRAPDRTAPTFFTSIGAPITVQIGCRLGRMPKS